MANGKRYYWLKLKEDFFQSKRIKKLRHMAGGDTYTIIYLKMQLLSLRTNGVLQWSGLEDNFADELALDLDEKPEDVEVTLMYLVNTGLVETIDNNALVLPWVLENTGSETASTQRWRDWKNRQVLESNTTPTQLQQVANVEIEKEKREKSKSKSEKFVPPTLDEVKAYITEKGYNVDPDYFYNYYEEGHWIDGEGKPVRNWKQKLITWQKKDAAKPKKQYTASADYKKPTIATDNYAEKMQKILTAFPGLEIQ